MILSHVVHALRAWRRYHACVRELSQLSDNELADIGVSRSGIPTVACRASQNDPADATPAPNARALDER